jgi:pyruvate/2-oxoglutarate dehydrogenase complex dihydrolipoamide acyltransferase (E2) component
MSLIELKVPDIGGHDNVDIIDVAVKVGDTVAVDDTLITLETDKATMDVPAETAGVVKEVKVAVGGKISEGGVIVVVEAAARLMRPKQKPQQQPLLQQKRLKPLRLRRKPQQFRRFCRCRLRCGGIGRRPWRLFGCVCRCRPRLENSDY